MSSLERLWAGWRTAYVERGARQDAEPAACSAPSWPAASPTRRPTWCGAIPTVLAVAILNAYPYTSGHLMVMPIRHVGDLEDLDRRRGRAPSGRASAEAVRALKAAYRPDGLNLGANLGRSAGAGIPGHFHLHVLPRWHGDTNFMTSVADTRVLPEALSASAARVRAAWPQRAKVARPGDQAGRTTGAHEAPRRGVMRLGRIKWWAAATTAGLAVSTVAAAGGIPAASRGVGWRTRSAERVGCSGRGPQQTGRARWRQPARSASTWCCPCRAPPAPRTSLQEVSTPGSALFHHYLTDAQWVARFGPTQAQVNAAEAWLRSAGLLRRARCRATGSWCPASGTAAQVERAFGTSLGNYQVNGKTVRLASTALSVPTHAGCDRLRRDGREPEPGDPGAHHRVRRPPARRQQNPIRSRRRRPASATRSRVRRTGARRLDTKDNPALYAPYTSPQPYDICGYTPAQLRGGYGLERPGCLGASTAAGVALAIVDAYDSPTLLSDAQLYFTAQRPGPSAVQGSQFTNIKPSTVGRSGHVRGQRLVSRSRPSTSSPPTPWPPAPISSSSGPRIALTTA